MNLNKTPNEGAIKGIWNCILWASTLHQLWKPGSGVVGSWVTITNYIDLLIRTSIWINNSQTNLCSQYSLKKVYLPSQSIVNQFCLVLRFSWSIAFPVILFQLKRLIVICILFRNSHTWISEGIIIFLLLLILFFEDFWGQGKPNYNWLFISHSAFLKGTLYQHRRIRARVGAKWASISFVLSKTKHIKISPIEIRKWGEIEI